MKKTVEEINKMIMEDAPMEEINDAIGYIDICSCFDPIFEPPIDFSGRMPQALGSGTVLFLQNH